MSQLFSGKDMLSFKGFYTFPYHKFNTNNANHHTHHLQYFPFAVQ